MATGVLLAASAAVAGAQDAIPVRKVELYKNGMGFFEHVGPVTDSQSVEIALPGSQLNDVLKSLTVLDMGKGQISGVTYDSVAPIDRRLAEIPIDLGSASGVVPLLNQIRGAGVEIKTPSGTVAGKLLGAENKMRSASSGETVEEAFVNVLGGNGEIHAVRLESAGALKLTDPALTGDLERALAILDGSHQRDVRRLRIQTTGSGQRQIYIGYTSEAPIWKTTYRIVLDPKQKPLLQGWAIVDNTTPMDWRDITLSLVAGAPISFIQNLSQPIYARRPEVPLAQGIQVAPQASEAVMEEMVESKVMEMAAPSMPMPSASVSRRVDASPPPVVKMSMGNAVRQQSAPAIQAAAVGEQFEYRLSQPVTIRRNESALLPILQTEIDGEKVAVYNVANREPHPRLAFRLKNSSGLTLDGGAVTVIDTNTFAGEGLIGTILPDESRLIGYAVDQGTGVSSNGASERQRVERVVVSGGSLRLSYKMVEKTLYKIRNNNDAARILVLEIPIRNGWKLTSAPPEETSANFYRFRVEVKPKSSTEFSVQEERAVEDVFAVTSLNANQIAVWARAGSLDAETEKELREVADWQAAIAALGQEIAALEAEREGIFTDQERLRENLQRLGQSPDEARLRQRHVKQLDAQESRLAVIKTDKEKLEAERETARAKLEEFIRKLSVDRKL
ncbi:hypothetical protein FACS189475_04130 [Betaproteobacteria bacterium]|nr:hypothetical protein FACS189475_04130 [Betaproteobacteria bacterium]